MPSSGFRGECRRKAFQCGGMLFAALGHLGAVFLLMAVFLDAIHLILHTRGGLPIWRSLRSLGERNGGATRIRQDHLGARLPLGSIPPLTGFATKLTTEFRNRERDPGPLLLALGAIPVLVFVRPPWSVAILALPFLADSAAAVLGSAVRSPHLPLGQRRTVLGSAAFLVVAFVSALLAGLPPAQSAKLAIAGMLVEWLSPKGFDNLLLPAVGFLVMLIST